MKPDHESVKPDKPTELPQNSNDNDIVTAEIPEPKPKITLERPLVETKKVEKRRMTISTVHHNNPMTIIQKSHSERIHHDHLKTPTQITSPPVSSFLDITYIF